MTLNKLITQVNRTLALGLCIGMVAVWAVSKRADAHGAISAIDFAGVYYPTRCALEHKDLYNPQTVLRELEANGQKAPGSTDVRWKRSIRAAVITSLYPPPTYLEVAPLAMLRWPVALTIWLALIACLLVLAALSMWDLASEAPWLGGCMVLFMLLNSGILLWYGNPAGAAVPLSVIAAWCLVKERYAASGVVALALSLAIKPQDAGFVWLYFLLAGGMVRRRAWQVLAITAVLGGFAIIWISRVSPHWPQEIHSNLAMFSAQGWLAGPGSPAADATTYTPKICLQSTFGVIAKNPRFYLPVSYVVGGGLILAWGIAVLRKRSTHKGALLALAAVSILTLLPVYHRAYDAKLLLLTIPACGMLWAEGGARRWIALGLTGAAIFVTSDVPTIMLSSIHWNQPFSDSTISGKLTLLALRPAPLVLLAAGSFYLWVYVRYVPGEAGERAAEAPPIGAAST